MRSRLKCRVITHWAAAKTKQTGGMYFEVAGKQECGPQGRAQLEDDASNDGVAECGGQLSGMKTLRRGNWTSAERMMMYCEDVSDPYERNGENISDVVIRGKVVGISSSSPTSISGLMILFSPSTTLGRR